MTSRSRIPLKPVPVVVKHALSRLGERSTVLRKARRMTQADLAHLADVGLSTIGSIEARHDGVTMGSMLKVLSALDLMAQADRLFELEGDRALMEYSRRQLMQPRDSHPAGTKPGGRNVR